MIIITWNIRAVGRKFFSAEFSHLIRLKNPDVVFVLETKLPPNKSDYFSRK